MEILATSPSGKKCQPRSLPSRAGVQQSARHFTGITIAQLRFDDSDAANCANKTEKRHKSTVGSIRQRKTDLRPDIGAGKPFPPQPTNGDDYVVEFLGPEDPLHPQNWPFRKKFATLVTLVPCKWLTIFWDRILISAILVYSTFTGCFASAIFSTTVHEVSEKFHVGFEVGTLGVSLYVLGFAFGPILWAPLSELGGRRLPLLIGLFGYSIFTIAVATGKDYQNLMICRFFSGFFSASALGVVPACFADMLSNQARGNAITLFAMAIFVGPFVAQPIGGFITISYLGWRWTMYVSALMGFFAFSLLVLFLDETYPPTILVRKAARLRRQTKNWGIHAKQEEFGVDFHGLLIKNFSRPVRLLFTEPIVLLITIYMSFIYGMMYILLAGYPIVFQGVHGMSEGIGGLPFLGLVVGQLLASIYICQSHASYNKKLAENNGKPIPEGRLPPVLLGAVCFAGGLFWFGWTGYTRTIHWIAPTASGVLTGFGILCIFVECLNYLLDSYLVFAASVVAANSLLRLLAGAGFPLFAAQTFNNLGVQWAGTLLGCLAAAMIPIPVVFWKWGAALRRRSKFALTSEEEVLAEAEEEAEKRV